MTDAVQTTMVADPTIGFAGQIYDTDNQDIITVIAGGALPYGAFVKIAAGIATLPAVTGDVTGYDGGVVLQDPSKATAGNGIVPAGGYVAGDLVQVMRRGRVWIASETANLGQARPYVRFTANTAPTRAIGGFLNGSDSGKAVQPTGVRIYRGVAALGMCVAQLDYPNMHAAGA